MSKLEDPKIREEFEGFLGNDFNGVIFLLREPNTENADSFWFKHCLNNTIPEGKDKKAYKGNFKKYKNRFQAMLTYVFPGSDKELRHAAYFNLRPDAGNRSKTKEYDERSKDSDYVTKKFNNIIDYCEKRHVGKLTVFTCSDIFKKLTECYDIPKDSDGVDYGEYGKKESFKFKLPDHPGTQIKVYEIIHPSRSPKLKFEKIKEDHS